MDRYNIVNITKYYAVVRKNMPDRVLKKKCAKNDRLLVKMAE